MARRDRYSLARIRRDYTYSVHEVAELFNITPDTVFRWIREEGGLGRIPNRKNASCTASSFGDLSKHSIGGISSLAPMMRPIAVSVGGRARLLRFNRGNAAPQRKYSDKGQVRRVWHRPE